MRKKVKVKAKNHFLKLAFKPYRSLGQNFLKSPDYLTRIASSCILPNIETIIEIGPGYGALTSHLVKIHPRKIICIEKDKRLVDWLSKNFPKQEVETNFLIGDALETEWETLLSGSEGVKVVVGNLAYNIANQLIAKLIVKRHFFNKLVFLVQKEVAQRWVATPYLYKSRYGSLSILIDYFCKTELLMEVARHSFEPVPPVDGAVVSLQFKKDVIIQSPNAAFFTFTKNCFRFPRKTLANNIKSFHGDEKLVKTVFNELSFQEKTRPQDLNTDQYLILFRMLY